MSAQGSKSEVVLALAEEFLDRYRHGERPSLKEYTDRHPELAAEIREVFPAMALMENIALDDDSLAAEPPGGGAAVPAPLQQLGDFRIIREVGHGGMGVVYEADQVSLGRHVALKVLPQTMLLDARRKRRFEREAKAAAKLHHTNIVPVFGVGEHDGLPYYVMQFIQGLSMDLVLEELKRLNGGQAGSLPGSVRPAGNGDRKSASAADLARSLMTGDFPPAEERFAGTDTTLEETPAAPNPHPAAAPPPTVSSGSIALPAPVGHPDGPRAKKPTYWQSVAQIGVQAADALEYAHRQGVLHRDIKPSNLLLDTRAGVWVTDFGLAKVEDQAHLTDTGDVLGTLRYMPPEAFDGRTDARSDVYALGLTLYELLAFRPAFDERDHARLVRQVTTGEPPRLRRLNPRVPRDLETIVHKAIDREPARRYQTAGELEADLRRFLADEPIQARRQSAAERLLRWARHHKGVAAALSAVALLLVLLATGALFAAASFRQLAAEKERQRGLAEQAKTAAEEAEKREKGLRALAEKQGGELRGNLYFAEMNLAGQAADSPSGIGRMNELLASWQLGRPDLRGWEWYYLKALGQRDRLTLRGHGAAVRAVAWNRDGMRLASASEDGTIKVWQAATGRETLTLHGHALGVTSVAWSPDGTRLASAGRDATVRVWDAATGKETLTLRGHGQAVWSVAWSPDGRWLASASADGTVKVWDAATGEKVRSLRGDTRGVWSVAWGPDGTRLASAGVDRTVKVWDAATGKDTLTLRGHNWDVLSVAWSPDGTRLASAGGDQTVRVWDAVSGKELLTLGGHSRDLWSVAWSPDGTWLASAGEDATIKVWDVATGMEALVRRFRQFLESDRTQGGETAAGKEVLTRRGHTGGALSVAWSPDGTRLASASADRTVKVWGAAADKETLALRGHALGVGSVDWSPDDMRLASAGGAGMAVKVWDAATGRETFTLRGHTSGVASAAWSPDGRWLASASGDRTVKVWDAATGKDILTLRGHAAGVYSVAWSPDGTRLASSSEDATVKVWDAATGKDTLTLHGHTQGVTSVAWSPDGTRLASSSWDTTVKVWDLTAGKETLTCHGHTGQVRSVAWSPDGRRLASASWDATVRLWDVSIGKEVLALRGHTGGVLSVAWSPDGTRLASAGWDATVKVWDAATGKEALTLRGHTGRVSALAWSHDGTRLASAGEDRTILVHDATIGYTLERSPRLLPVLDRRLAAEPKNLKDRRLRAEIRAGLADWDRAAADVRQYLALSPDHPRWYTTDWWVVGPYPEDLKASYPPENNPDPSQPVAATSNSLAAWIRLRSSRVGGEVGLNASIAKQAGITPPPFPWQVVPRDANGFVDFGALFEGAEHISAYALTRVYSPEKQQVAILLGSDDGVRLWLNGELVHEHPEPRMAEPDQDAVPATLKAGWNTLLAKVVNVVREHALYLRLSAAPADLARAWNERGYLLERRGEGEEAAAAYARALEVAPEEEASLLLRRGSFRARQGRWRPAADDYTRALRLAPDAYIGWYELAAVRLRLGDLDGYHRSCREMLRHFGGTAAPFEAERTAKACLIVPDAVAEREQLVRLTEQALTLPHPQWAQPWFQQSRGLAELRAGRPRQAIDWIRKGLEQPEGAPPVYAAEGQLFLSLAYHQVGEDDQARAALGRAVEIIDHQLPQADSGDLGDGWLDWVFCQVVRREAEAVVADKE